MEAFAPEDLPNPTQLGPGSSLRMAREQANMSVASVAAHLHLTSQLINDIENDDYRRAPQKVFLRGYLRSYAKLLDIDDSEIVTAFNDLQINENTTTDSINVLKPEYDSKKTQQRWFLWLLTLVILISVFSWFSNKRNTVTTNTNNSPIIIGTATGETSTIKNVAVKTTTLSVPNKQINSKQTKS